MDCKEFKKVSGGFLEEAIPPERQQEVQEHLAGCPICTGLLHQMKLLRERMRTALCKDCCPGNLRQRMETSLQKCPLHRMLVNLFHRLTKRPSG